MRIVKCAKFTRLSCTCFSNWIPKFSPANAKRLGSRSKVYEIFHATQSCNALIRATSAIGQQSAEQSGTSKSWSLLRLRTSFVVQSNRPPTRTEIKTNATLGVYNYCTTLPRPCHWIKSLKYWTLWMWNKRCQNFDLQNFVPKIIWICTTSFSKFFRLKFVYLYY